MAYEISALPMSLFRTFVGINRHDKKSTACGRWAWCDEDIPRHFGESEPKSSTLSTDLPRNTERIVSRRSVLNREILPALFQWTRFTGARLQTDGVFRINCSSF